MVELEQKGGVFILSIPHVFTVPLIQEVHRALDTVEKHDGPTALVFRSTHPNIFHAGMNIKLLQKEGPEEFFRIYENLQKLCARLLSIGLPTIAACNGPVVAGGFIFLGAISYVVSSPTAFFSMTELKLGMVVEKSGYMILRSKMDERTIRDIALFGRRIEAEEGLRRKIIDEIVPKEKVLERAIELANELAPLGERREVHQCIKQSMYKDIIESGVHASYPDEFKVHVRNAFNLPKL
ncbi:unnamed protein product [Blepharisma stoltei]|uniref:Enoyl-CoA hydratase/isomerase n=1 Tax=Blepharisma stoltei TaxID=1481888 RepID=A0AAU9IGS1_9CILI|nr:unnamed protein product [Blepharisma stoltei]